MAVIYVASSLLGGLLVGVWMGLVLRYLRQIRDILRPAPEPQLPEREPDFVADGLARIERGFK